MAPAAIQDAIEIDWLVRDDDSVITANFFLAEELPAFRQVDVGPVHFECPYRTNNDVGWR
jgi:hypothetical protein